MSISWEEEKREERRRTWKMTFVNQPQLMFLAVWKRSSSCFFFPSSSRVAASGKRLFWLISLSFIAIELWLLHEERESERKVREARERGTNREKTRARAMAEGGMRKSLLLATTSGWISPFDMVRMPIIPASSLPCMRRERVSTGR